MYPLFFNIYIEMRNLQFEIPAVSISEKPILHRK